MNPSIIAPLPGHSTLNDLYSINPACTNTDEWWGLGPLFGSQQQSSMDV